MRLLLDTHTLLWSLSEPHRIPSRVRRQIEGSRNEIYYSSASLFELATKRAAGRRSSPSISTERIRELADATGYEPLSITPQHATAVESIAPFHGDPIDHLLLAQAQVEVMRLVTHDEQLAAYDSRTLLF